VTRDVYEEKGLYDTRLHYAADYDFFIRSVLNSVRFVHVPQTLVAFSNTGATYNNVTRSNREALQVHRNHFGVFSRNFIYFFFYRVLRSFFVTGARRTLGRMISKERMASVKMFYNKVAHRESNRL
jgi:hypothetical protein